MLRLRRTAPLLFAIVTLFAACASSPGGTTTPAHPGSPDPGSPDPGSPDPGSPDPASAPGPTGSPEPWPPENECETDGDCGGGKICVEKLRAACDTCEGGVMVLVCDAPTPCSQDGDCVAPFKCLNEACRTIVR